MEIVVKKLNWVMLAVSTVPLPRSFYKRNRQCALYMT